MREGLINFFGKDFTRNERTYYYDYIENYISENVIDWKKAPDTDSLAVRFAKKIEQLPNPEFSFLLLTTGYLLSFMDMTLHKKHFILS